MPSKKNLVDGVPANSRQAPENGGNIFVRSWARLSRRRKKQPAPPSLESASTPEVEDAPTPSTSSAPPPSTTTRQQLPLRLAETPSARSPAKPLINRGMDKLRRSIRKSFRRGGSALTSGGNDHHSLTTIDESSSSSKSPWHVDEKAVREGSCKFNVKYLGCTQVYEARGVDVCDAALQLLKDKKRSTKAILYISGDALRVVDRESNRGLIVDQTIEKVSFCAPEKTCDKGFAYICREGVTRRWMCHGFMTTKESGERVSHAVGCAFNICLEQKNKREAELASSSAPSSSTAVATAAAKLSASVAANKSADLNAVWDAVPAIAEQSSSSSSTAATSASTAPSGFAKTNPAYASFRRQLSLTERKQDPQTAIISEPPPVVVSPRAAANLPAAKPRPHANPLIFERQGSFKSPVNPANAFKRFNSLRNDAANRPNYESTLVQCPEPIYEGDEWPETCLSSISKPAPESNFGRGSGSGSDSNKENGPTPAPAPAWLHMFDSTDESPQQPLPPRPVSEPEPVPESSKAAEWLDQILKLSLQSPVSPSPSATLPSLPSQSSDLIQFDAPFELASPKTAPVLNKTTLPNLGGYQMPDQAATRPLNLDLRQPAPLLPLQEVPQAPPTDDIIKIHARKGSSSRKAIEYQILEETDAPLSPIKPAFPVVSAASSSTDPFGLPLFAAPASVVSRTGPSLSDPFDVKWSTVILESTANNVPPSQPDPTTNCNPFAAGAPTVNV